MSRSIAREVAMKLVYSQMLGGADTADAILEKSEIAEMLSEADLSFAREIAEGVFEHVEELDAAISEHAIGWTLERIAKVDLSILRIAVYEMLHRKDVPVGASINEAVELAKRFCGENSYSFINGILGTVAKELPEA